VMVKTNVQGVIGMAKFAVDGGNSDSHIDTAATWFRPTGFGTATMNGYVCRSTVCAWAMGIDNIIEQAKISIRIKAKAFFDLCP